MSRFDVGARGWLTKPIRTLCCNDEIPAGVEIEVYEKLSPNRAMIREYPARPFLQCGHSFTHPTGDHQKMVEALDAMPKQGTLADMVMPDACPVHKIKLSALWLT